MAMPVSNQKRHLNAFLICSTSLHKATLLNTQLGLPKKPMWDDGYHDALRNAVQSVLLNDTPHHHIEASREEDNTTTNSQKYCSPKKVYSIEGAISSDFSITTLILNQFGYTFTGHLL